VYALPFARYFFMVVKRFSIRMRREDFTKELLACVETKSADCTIHTKWEPDGVCAPERHFVLGKDTQLSNDAQYKLLMKYNEAFDVIDSLLNLRLHKTVYESFALPVDSEKEQVWLFAFYWARRYYNELMEPDIMHSPFYRQDHSRFIELLTKMCAFRPEKRITFLNAARLWCPGMLSSPEQSPDVSEDEAPEPNGADVSSDGAAPSCADVQSQTDGPSTTLPPSSDSSVRRRLVLKGLHGRQGRNKTRRSSRN